MTLRLRHAGTLALFAWSAPVVFCATLTGRIYSDQGPPVSNVPVSVQPTIAASTGLTTYMAITDAQGKFTVAVPAGATYSVCAAEPNRGLLNSCEWSLALSLVQIPANASSARMTLTLVTGVALRFRLNDATGLVPRPGATATATSANGASAASTVAANSTPIVQFGLLDADGHLHAVREVSGDEQGVTFAILAPLNSNFKLTVQGTNIQVADQTGASVLSSTRSVSSSPTAAAQTPIFQATAATASSVTPSTGIAP